MERGKAILNPPTERMNKKLKKLNNIKFIGLFNTISTMYKKYF